MRVSLRLNDQQLAVIDGLLARTGAAESLDDLVALAVAHDAGRPVDPRWRRPRPAGQPPSAPAPDARIDAVIEAGTGRGVALARGEVIRVEQIVEGQCVDLNAFALADPRRRFSASRTRASHGLRPTTGAILWSAPPETPLLSIVADSAGGHDLGFPACSADEYERVTGLHDHSNCIDIQIEAQREWGLAADAVHDPLNLWLPSGVTPDGELRSWPAACRSGDFVELRALTDVLVVVNPCGDDLFGSSQYELGPVRLVVPSSGDAPAVPSGDPPRWRWRGLPTREVEVDVPGRLEGHVASVRDRGWLGFSDAEVVRALLFRWWEAQLGGSL